ncbi:family 43 glycosylhydrolase [Clostridium sp. SHJSY1]|uniref:family 43 glycosylhydrolase n=1 Tax=Clostridium sp. SHJSY1 TaxID=2942483 RepID=UPI002874AEE5|nr:family 43 glycosylhydrolase [Clostridium sp. SHJSY1]MDS0526751.1 family 43 glycosylhydrolase [Clostridium sp. SHJSY1]
MRKVKIKNIYKRALSIAIASTMFSMMSGGFIARADNENLENHLKLHYDFSQKEGSTLKDVSNNGNDGQLFGGATYVEGIGNGALQLDGVNGYVKLPDNITSGLSDFTISTTYKIDSASQWARLFDFGSGVDNYMFYTPTSNQSTSRIAFSKNSKETYYDTTKLVNDTNTWRNLTLVMSKGNLTIYDNGDEILNKKVDVTLNHLGNTTRNFIGKSQYDGILSKYNDPYFKGKIADFKIYDTALDKDNVKELSLGLEGDLLSSDVKKLSLNNTEVSGDITLPAVGEYGSKVTWTSSNNDVITSEGKVNRQAVNTKVKLIATVTRGELSSTKDFDVTVLAPNQKEDIQKDFNELSVGLVTVATEDLYLKTTAKYGSTVSWKSSDTSLIEDNGKVHRPAKGEGNKNVTLTATIRNGDYTMSKDFDVKVLEEYSAYVMAYFTGEQTEISDSLHLAYSYDGVNWTALNNNKGILFPKTGTKHIRDPFLFRKQDGSFGLLATNNWSSNQIYTWNSNDMINYSDENLVTMNSDGQHAWAPECIYDKKNGQYRIFWSGNVIYSNTTSDFKTMSDPKEYFNPGYSVIDATVVENNDSYYMVYKDETNSGKSIKVAKSNSLEPGSFNVITNNFITNSKCEGPTVVKSLNSKDWYVLYDRYYEGKWGAVKNTNLDDEAGWKTLSGTEFTIPKGARHGSTVKVTEAELDNLKNKLGNVTNTGVEDVTVTTKEGVKPELPNKVQMKYSDGSTEKMDVNWENVDESKYKSEGSFEVKGTVPNLDEYSKPLIEQRADPYIYKHSDGYYYFTATVPEYDKIVLRRSKTIEGLKDAEEFTIWTKHATGEMGSHIWAPELHYIDGKWYMYFAAGGAEDVWGIKPYVLECDGDNPIDGTWTEKGVVQKATENNSVVNAFSNFSLDATTFELNGQRYLVWAQKDAAGNSSLYMDKMVNPYTIEGNPILLTSPEYGWETIRYNVNEGPTVINKNGKVFILFSAAGTGSEYCVGMLQADEKSDLMDKTSWKKTAYPVLTTEDLKGEYGPGHCTFTVDEKGNDILVYHARSYAEISGDPLNDPNRGARILRVHWNSDGTPNLRMSNEDVLNDKFKTVTATVNVVKKEKTITSIDKTSLTTEVGKSVDLPNVVNVNYSDGTQSRVEVLWNKYNEELLNKPGKFEVEGTVQGIEIKAVAEITVLKPDIPDPSIFDIIKNFFDNILDWLKKIFN